MGGLAAVQADKDVVDDDAAVMLASGHELAHQMTDPLRRLKLWRPDVLHGIFTHWKFKVCHHSRNSEPEQQREPFLFACPLCHAQAHHGLTQGHALHLHMCCKADRFRAHA